MKQAVSLLAINLLLTSSLAAAPSGKPERMRQLSEVVFQNYPERALARGEQGAVYFVVSLDKDAHPTSCQVTHGSGHPLLDEETCDLILQHAVFNSIRDSQGRVTKSTHEGVVYWRIPGAPAPSVTPVPLTKATAPDKRICKKNVRIGTLAGVERTCMTEREWARQSAEIREMWDEVQGRKGMSGCDFGGVVTANHPGQAPAPAAGSGGVC